MYRARLRISEKGGTRNAWALGGVNVILMSHLDFVYFCYHGNLVTGLCGGFLGKNSLWHISNDATLPKIQVFSMISSKRPENFTQFNSLPKIIISMQYCQI